MSHPREPGSPAIDPAIPEQHLPEPSVWPFVLGAGLTLLAFGVVSSLAFSILGILLVGYAVVGWIGQMRAAADHGEPPGAAHG